MSSNPPEDGKGKSHDGEPSFSFEEVAKSLESIAASARTPEQTRILREQLGEAHELVRKVEEFHGGEHEEEWQELTSMLKEELAQAHDAAKEEGNEAIRQITDNAMYRTEAIEDDDKKAFQDVRAQAGQAAGVLLSLDPVYPDREAQEVALKELEALSQQLDDLIRFNYDGSRKKLIEMVYEISKILPAEQAAALRVIAERMQDDVESDANQLDDDTVSLQEAVHHLREKF